MSTRAEIKEMLEEIAVTRCSVCTMLGPIKLWTNVSVRDDAWMFSFAHGCTKLIPIDDGEELFSLRKGQAIEQVLKAFDRAFSLGGQGSFMLHYDFRDGVASMYYSWHVYTREVPPLVDFEESGPDDDDRFANV